MNMVQSPALSSPAIARGAVAAQSAPPYPLQGGPHGAGSASGERACAQAWDRVRALEPAAWLRLAPAARAKGRRDQDLCLACGAASVPYGRIAHQTNAASVRGIDGATAPALVLLAALAIERYGGGDAALRMADTARQLAARHGGPDADAVAALHAALITPHGAGLHQAAAMLSTLCENGGARPLAALALASAGPVTAMPLPLLTRHLDKAGEPALAGGSARAAASELVTRAWLLRRLLAPQDDARASGPMPDAGPEERFGHALTRLQAAWYDDDMARARQAAQRALALAGPLTPIADRMTLHLFAAMTLAASPVAALDGLRRQCALLHALAGRYPTAAPMAELASALLDRRSGDPVGALRGFERADANAARRGLHWVAALAAEQAALQAAESGLGTAARHYRRQALDGWLRWGALGRLDALQRRWRAPDAANDGDGGAGRDAYAHERERVQRAETIGEIGVSIAHEVNQPLAAIALHAAAARKWLRRGEPDLERALASLSLISAAGRQAGDIVRSVHRLASRQDNEFGKVALDAAVAEALHLLARPLRRGGVELELALGLDDCTLRANRVQLQQVVTNLVLNAIEAFGTLAAPQGGRRIRVGTRRYNDGEIEITVADNGPGIAPADRARMFGRLFSTKANSTGMGLSISLAIARAHGGQLMFEPCEPHGARFCLRLPCSTTPLP